jgi:hypothetical protein
MIRPFTRTEKVGLTLAFLAGVTHGFLAACWDLAIDQKRC